MNAIEEIIHSTIGDYPFLRKPIVLMYQRLFSVLPVKDYQISEFIQRPGYFYGFHDTCPWSPDDLKILAHKFDPTKSMRQIETGPIEIGFFKDASLKDFKTLSYTHAWNWQQGSSLNWVGRNIIFNDFYKGESIANIIDLNGNILKTLPCHVACVSNNGRFGLTFSFERLGRGMPGYGYQFVGKAIKKYRDIETLGIIDIETLEHKKLYSLEEIAQIEPRDAMNNSFHFFSHCLISKNDERFLFFHNWVRPSGKLEVRMFSSDVTGKDLFLFPGSQFSHITWKDNETILAYFKPYNRKLGYYCVKDLHTDSVRIAERFLDLDGHPQFSSDQRYIVTDTYPDRFRNQYLKLYAFETESGIVLAKLRIPFPYRNDRRCDFHPRWSRDNSMICFDSAHNNIRSLCIISTPLQFKQYDANTSLK